MMLYIRSLIQAITINPARHIGIEDRVGSLEPGKDADIVLTDGDPMVSDMTVRYVIAEGEVVAGTDKDKGREYGGYGLEGAV